MYYFMLLARRRGAHSLPWTATADLRDRLLGQAQDTGLLAPSGKRVNRG